MDGSINRMNGPENANPETIVAWVMGLLAAFNTVLLKVLYGKWTEERIENKARIAQLEDTLVSLANKLDACEDKHLASNVENARLSERVANLERIQKRGDA